MKEFPEYHRRYIYKFAGIIAISSIIIIGLNFYSIRILSSIRAYVNGESEYSKAQKDATRYLIDFIQTSDLKSYQSFKEELSVPIGDSLARVGLENNHPDNEIIKAALQGRNHPDDIQNMIWMFRTFENFSFFKQVISKWAAGDRDVGELDRIGKFIYDLKNSNLNPAVKTSLTLKVNTINRRLTYNQQAFCTLLGEASRLVANSLIIINVFFILLVLLSVGIFSRNTFRQLVESKKLILEQNKAKDEFMSIASHELKTPLTSMKASLQILERFSKGSKEAMQMHPFISNANKQVNRLTDLVKDLLDVTKIQSGKLQINRQPFLLNDLIGEVVDSNRQASGHEFVIENLPKVYVNADSTRIYQVVENFLSNAIKYSANSDKIVTWSELQDRHVKVCVKDFGGGIPRDKIPHLFERFYRIEETRHTVQGLGLGLYICKEIVENHGGTIGAESEIGKGSTFWFRIPMLKILDYKRSDAVVDQNVLNEIKTRDSDLPTV
jgi:signal transduction histidine kinase